MSQPYIGEIRMVGFNFAPSGWAECNGALIPISENDTLYALIGTTYGGDGQSTFALPDLRSRVPIHAGTGPDGTTYQLAEASGTEAVTLTAQQMPAHNHSVLASTAAGTSVNPQDRILAAGTSRRLYLQVAPDTAFSAQAVVPWAGGSQPHENLMPYLTVHYIISLFGIYPPQ